MVLLHTLEEEGLGCLAHTTLRRAARAVIRRGDALVLIRSRRYGEYKFLGGGVQEGEDLPAALLREVREEGGLAVLPDTICPYGFTIERRAALEPDTLLEQYSYYYWCETDGKIGPTHQDDYEREYGYRLAVVPPREAWTANSRLLASGDCPPWTRRDTWVLARLAEELEQAAAPERNDSNEEDTQT